MLDQFMLYLALAAIVAQTAARSGSVIGSGIYDALQVRRPLKDSKRKRPLISVLVYVRNDEQTIGACLHSIAASSLRNLEVIIIDNGSSDSSTDIIKACLRTHSRRNMRLIRKRNKTGREAAYASARRYVNGEYVLLLEGAMLLSKHTLKEVAIWTSRSRADIGTLPQRMMPNLSYTNLLLQYRYAEQDTIAKAVSTIHVNRIGMQPGTVYRKANFRLTASEPPERAPTTPIYRQDINSTKNVFNIYVQQNIFPLYIYRGRNLLKRVRNASIAALFSVALLEPAACLYFIYQALIGHNHVLFLWCWGLYVLWIGAVLWGDVGRKSHETTTLIVLAPIGFVFHLGVYAVVLFYSVGKGLYTLGCKVWLYTTKATEAANKRLTRSTVVGVESP